MMKKTSFSVLFLLCGTLALSSTASAKSKQAPVDEAPAPEISTTINTYDNQMIEAAQIAEATARSRSHRHCWRAVKQAMLDANVLDDRPTTKYAKQAGEELEQKYGFKKLDVSDPYDAPIGAILVYGGRGAGHVEIRTASGFVSDVLCTHPSHRPLIGVYVRV